MHFFFFEQQRKIYYYKRKRGYKRREQNNKKNGITTEEIRPKEVGTHPCDKMELILGYKRWHVFKKGEQLVLGEDTRENTRFQEGVID